MQRTYTTGRLLRAPPCAAAPRAPRRPAAPPRAAGPISSVSLGPPSGGGASTTGPSTPSSSTRKTEVLALDAVDLTSEAGIDWTPLRDALAAGDFRTANDVHRAKLIELAGPGAVARGWVYFSEVKTMPATDLRVMDALWRAASNAKFGFSAQRAIYRAQGKRWDRFFKAIDWTVGKDANYRKWPGEFQYSTDAVAGHLPLTNALRGTQLFEAILEHPAWETAPQGVAAGGEGKSGPAWLT